MTTPAFSLMRVKALALPVSDFDRAIRFYTETLGLPPATDDGMQVGNWIGDTVVLLKTDWPAPPSDALTPRVTLETESARATEEALRAKGVRIPDPVAHFGAAQVGSFLDSEGNKLWFCSGPGPK